MKKTVKKRKVKKKALLFLFLILLALGFTVFYVFNFHITNIYISGNTVYTDQEIIDKSKLSDYPRTLNNSELLIKSRLEKDKYIKKAKIRKRSFLREVYIEIKENTPMFIYQDKTILKDGQAVDDKHLVPTVINEISNTKVYNKLITNLDLVNIDIRNRISEIKYDPNDVDKERFLLYMSDGNHVYITLRKIERINEYVEIISAFDGKKGILYLDSGEYFETFGG